MSIDEQVLVVGALLAGGVAASLLASRLRVPSLLLFLVLGMVIGSDVTGWVSFSDYELAKDVGIVALALILFDGGLSTGWSEIRPVLGVTLSLAIAGTVLTATITGLVAAPLLGLTTLEGLLLGAVLSSTDGAAVFALLRGSRLPARLARTLEGESGLNDPVAVVLVIVLIDLITKPSVSAADVVVFVVREFGIGILAGMGIGVLAARLAPRLRLASPGLYPVASLAVAALSYGSAASLHGSGFLAVYLTGLTLAGAALPGGRAVTAFHDGLAWVAQVGLFVTLGLLVFPGRLGDVALEAAALAVLLAVIARPLATAVAVAPFGFDRRETALLGWAGLRGAVPVVLATFVVAGGVPDAEDIFDIVFFAVVLSVLVQGTTIEPLARRLGLTPHRPAPGEPPG